MTGADALRRRLDALDGSTALRFVWAEKDETDPASHARAVAEEARLRAEDPRLRVIQGITVDGGMLP